MSSQDLPKPDYVRNMKLIGHTDQGGRPDGVQLMINKGYAFVGHMFSKGFSVIDVRNPRQPKPVKYIPAPPNTWMIHLQTYGDLLLVINAMDMFAAAALQDEKQYYTGSLSEKPPCPTGAGSPMSATSGASPWAPPSWVASRRTGSSLWPCPCGAPTAPSPARWAGASP